ncbi:hypothetical protein ASZ90_010938 [hydrocarbon metagenome]|uniref:Uncharacterized protein n=1 Tax=hydrocarbon metagenome TaxID=938273 RepID=A0A0W8FEM5_9ZZZZ
MDVLSSDIPMKVEPPPVNVRLSLLDSIPAILMEETPTLPGQSEKIRFGIDIRSWIFIHCACSPFPGLHGRFL